MIKYPYTDFHEMNLDWLLQQMKELNERMDNFVTEITADIIPIVQQAIEEGIIDVTYDSTNETVVLVPGAGVTSQHLAKFFQINNFKYPVADQTARNTINNWIDGFNYTYKNMYKKAVFIGDSYLDGWSPDGSYESWGVRLAGKLGLTVDTDCFIYSQGGSGFGATNNNRNFPSMLTEAVNDNRFNNDDVDLIIAGGGFNDQYIADNDIRTGISNFATIAANFPNSRVYVADMCFSQITAASRSTAYQKEKVSDAYFAGATIRGLLPFTDCWKALWGKNNAGSILMASDDAHPNQAGQEELARALFSFITAGSYTIPEKAIMGTNPVSSTYAKITPDGVAVGLANTQMLSTGNLSSTSGSANGQDLYIEFPTIEGFEPVTNLKNWGTAEVLLRDSTGYYVISAIAGVYGGKIRLYPVDINDNKNNYRSFTNISTVQVQSISMFVPAIFA